MQKAQRMRALGPRHMLTPHASTAVSEEHDVTPPRPLAQRHPRLTSVLLLMGAIASLSASGAALSAGSAPLEGVLSKQPNTAPRASPPPAAEGRLVTRRCRAFRPDRRYGDVAQRIGTDRVMCAQARRIIAAFHNYDRDQGRYSPVRIEGFRCRLGSSAPEYVGRFGTCTAGRRYVRWQFIEYTG